MMENLLEKLIVQTSGFEHQDKVASSVNPNYSRVFYISNLPREEIEDNVNKLNRATKYIYGYSEAKIVDKLPDKEYLVKNDITIGPGDTIILLPKEFVYSSGKLMINKDLEFIINVLENIIFN